MFQGQNLGFQGVEFRVESLGFGAKDYGLGTGNLHMGLPRVAI